MPLRGEPLPLGLMWSADPQGWAVYCRLCDVEFRQDRPTRIYADDPEANDRVRLTVRAEATAHLASAHRHDLPSSGRREPAVLYDQIRERHRRLALVRKQGEAEKQRREAEARQARRQAPALMAAVTSFEGDLATLRDQAETLCRHLEDSGIRKGERIRDALRSLEEAVCAVQRGVHEKLDPTGVRGPQDFWCDARDCDGAAVWRLRFDKPEVRTRSVCPDHRLQLRRRAVVVEEERLIPGPITRTG